VKPLRIGQYRQRLTLQSPPVPGSETFDSFGQPVPNWTTVGTYWGYLRPLMGHEAVVAKQIKAEATHQLSTRYLGSSVAINPTYRWLLGSRVFGIVQIINVEERNRSYEMLVREIQQSGKV
jgi:SPP1 family predicted phage head-tail adaptor